MAGNELIPMEFGQFSEDLKQSKLKIDEEVEALENQMKDRDKRRKEIFLSELKKALIALGDKDKDICKDLKSDAFDMIRSISKIVNEIEVLQESLHSSLDRNPIEFLSKLKNLKLKFESLDVDSFVLSLRVGVGHQSQTLSLVREQLNNAVFLQSPLLNASMLCLDLSPSEESLNTVSIRLVHPATMTMSTNMLRRVMMNNNSEQLTVLEMMDKKKAWMTGPDCVRVHVRRPSDEKSQMRISVTVYGSHILHSPGVVPGLATAAVMDRMDATMADLTLSAFDMTSLPDRSLHNVMATNNVLLNPHISSLKKFNSCVPTQLNNSTPFLPHSEGAVSTMRGTMSAGLSAALFSAQTEDDSLLAPSTTSGLLVKDMQASLSGSEAETGERDVMLERSVSFAPSTQVFLPVANDNLLRMEQGLTKYKDGVAGQVKRLQRPVESLTINESRENSQENKQLYSEPSSEVPGMSNKEDKDEALETDDDNVQEDDLHVMLNASKAPAPGCSWLDDVPDWDTTDHPCNTSMLPNSSIMEQTLWDIEAQDPLHEFNFLSGSLELAEVISSQAVTTDTMRHCLTSPCCMTFLPSRSVVLVTEPQHNRVGVYDAERMQFKDWLRHPENDECYYNYPTAILCLENGFLWVVEKHMIQIFTEHVQPFQTIRGRFCGLAEGPEGEVFTLKQDQGLKIFLKKFEKKKGNPRVQYKFASTIRLTVNKNFDNWATLSKVRFLAYSLDIIYITDLGLHKMYMVNMATGEQTATGYMGNKEGQVRRPTGLIGDDVGNILLADSENNRLVVFKKDGHFVKVIGSEVGKFSAPHGLVRQGNTVLVVNMGREGSGCVVRFRVKQEEQNMGQGRKLLE